VLEKVLKLASVDTRTKKFKSAEICRAYEIERPTIAPSMVSLPKTAKIDAKRTTNDPKISNRIPSQRLATILRYVTD
jgi:hypothetical protein